MSTTKLLTMAALLGLLLLRAAIPAGFMPAPGLPFALEICRGGPDPALPTQHDRTTGTHTAAGDCPFGNTPASAPVPSVVLYTPPGPIAYERSFPVPARLQRLTPRAHRARAPPAAA